MSPLPARRLMPCGNAWKVSAAGTSATSLCAARMISPAVPGLKSAQVIRAEVALSQPFDQGVVGQQFPGLTDRHQAREDLAAQGLPAVATQVARQHLLVAVSIIIIAIEATTRIGGPLPQVVVVSFGSANCKAIDKPGVYVR